MPINEKPTEETDEIAHLSRQLLERINGHLTRAPIKGWHSERLQQSLSLWLLEYQR